MSMLAISFFGQFSDGRFSMQNHSPDRAKRPQIDKAKVRATLAPHKEPYWAAPLAPGLFLGFRKLDEGGTWAVRQRDRDGKQKFSSLGNVAHMDYREAVSAAIKWGKELIDGVGNSEIKTVADLCAAYVSDRRREKGEKTANKAVLVFNKHIYNKPIAKILVKNITTKDIKDWRDSLTSLANGSKDRMLRDLKAALNHGQRDLRLVSKDRAIEWENVKFYNDDDRRNQVLTKEERDRFVELADPVIQPFLRALCLLPIRPGAMAALTVESLRDKNKGYEYLFVGEDKACPNRPVPLDANTLRFFKEQAKGKLPKAPLFSNTYGTRWHSDTYRKFVERARIAAELPKGICAYTLRHSLISDMITIGRMDIMTVARIAGTSIDQINDHYGKLNADVAREQMMAMAL
jgi:integrase